MGIDIRYPIGLMFSIFGLLLTVFGFATMNDPAVYQRSFGINVNLWSGLFMLVFGGFMLLMAAMAKKNKQGQNKF
jgi:hypothetical protein